MTQDELQHFVLTLKKESEGFGSIAQCSNNLGGSHLFWFVFSSLYIILHFSLKDLSLTTFLK